MIFYKRHSDSSRLIRYKKSSGMTLVEVMIASALMLLVIIGVLSANYIGLEEDQLIESKAGASDTSRQSVNDLLKDIRGAKGYAIGTLAGTNFTQCASGSSQQGAALTLYPIIKSTTQTIDTTKYIQYYFDSSNIANSDGHLCRLVNTNGTGATTTIIASNLINTLSFSSEDYQGTVQTTRTYKGVIHTTLQFCQFKYPMTKVGSNYIYNYYRIDCRATPHLPDGP